MRKKQFILLLISLCWSFCSYAQDGKKKQMRAFVEDRIQYITSQVTLTKEESEKFIPLYKEYQEKRIEAFMNDASEQKNVDTKTFTEDDFRKKNESHVNNRLNKAALDRVYYEKFRKVLPESKIYEIINAEKNYKNVLLKKVENKGNQSAK